MSKKEKDEYQEQLMKGAKNTLGLGVVTTVGSSVLGTIGGSVPGAAPGLQSANVALGLANVGNLAQVGMNLVPRQTAKKAKKKVEGKYNPLKYL